MLLVAQTNTIKRCVLIERTKNNECKGLLDINKEQTDLLETSKQAWLDPACIAKKFTTHLNSVGGGILMKT